MGVLENLKKTLTSTETNDHNQLQEHNKYQPSPTIAQTEPSVHPGAQTVVLIMFAASEHVNALHNTKAGSVHQIFHLRRVQVMDTELQFYDQRF